MRIERFVVEGTQRYDPATLQVVLDAFRNRELDFDGLQQAADAITEHYRRNGWHAVATLPQQDLLNGVLRIVVVEGRVGQVRLADESPMPKHVPVGQIRRYVDRTVQRGAALNLEALARATGISNELPGARVGSVLAAGAAQGETDVVLQVQPRPFVNGNVGVDNQDALSTGDTKATAALMFNSPTGMGEQYQLNATRSQGKSYARAAASVPVGDDGWRVGASTSWLNYKLVGDAALTLGSGQPNGARGDASTWGLNASYPLLRRGDAGVMLTLAADHRATRSETALGLTSDKRGDTASVGLQADQTDGWGGGGASAASITFTRGRIDLSRVPTDLQTDAAGAHVQGYFTRVNLSLTRLQRLFDEHSLWLVLNGQTANRNLDGGEKFSLGGPQGVRAYPVLEGSGDKGAVLNAAWRWQASPAWRLEAFYDAGWVHRAITPYTGASQPNAFWLRGAGLGADWTPDSQWRLSATLASRIGSNPGAQSSGHDNDGTLRRLRAWLGATCAF